MHISATPLIPAHSLLTVTAPVAAPADEAANGEDSTAIVDESSAGERLDQRFQSHPHNSRGENESDHKKNGQQTVENSPQARRAALEDPNSPESRQLQELKTRDREVRSHEQAHLAAAGQHARGGPTYEFQKGPDGRRYAVGGHVKIDTSPVTDDPEATLRKAEVIRRAALAPAEPSPQDRSVAAEATSMASQARQEIQQLRIEEAAMQRVSATQKHFTQEPGENKSHVTITREFFIRDPHNEVGTVLDIRA